MVDKIAILTMYLGHTRFSQVISNKGPAVHLLENKVQRFGKVICGIRYGAFLMKRAGQFNPSRVTRRFVQVSGGIRVRQCQIVNTEKKYTKGTAKKVHTIIIH